MLRNRESSSCFIAGLGQEGMTGKLTATAASKRGLKTALPPVEPAASDSRVSAHSLALD